MQKKRLRNQVGRALVVGSVVVVGTVGVMGGVASATIPDPASGYPHWYNGNVETIRDSGSDTTFYLMQRLGDLFTSAGLYGCTLNSSAGQTLYDGGSSTTSNEEYYCVTNGDTSTSDNNDNWDRTEVQEGVDDVGSGAGQNQLCNALSAPLPVDFARSSKPSAGISGCNEVETGYAKDAAPAVDFPAINPSSFGTATFSTYAAVNGGSIGPVAAGWEPGDPVTGPYTGTKLTNIDNSTGANSTAYRLWCANNGTRITDWGQLTNLGPNLDVVGVTTNSTNQVTLTSGAAFPASVAATDAVSGPGIPSGTTVSSVSGDGKTITLSNSATASSTTATLIFHIATPYTSGNGYPIGLPVRIMGVNSSSGTEATFSLYAESGVSGGGCASNLNGNAANDPNPATQGTVGTAAHIALENDAAQVGQYSAGDFPSDLPDQAVEDATTLYFASNGVLNTNPYAGSTPIGTQTIAASKISLNGANPTTPTILQNTYPTARTLFNIFSSNNVRASTGGFVNWLCDSNTAFQKGLDNETGKNFDSEITTLVNGTFGFIRLSDATPAATTSTPADNQPAPNNTCAGSQQVNTTTTNISGQNSNQLVENAGGNFPTAIQAGWTVTGPGIPSGTTVLSNDGLTLTLSAAATATASNVQVSFPNEPAVLSVANANT
jgi:hypothetical protein